MTGEGKKPPKGGSKGGTRFPRLELAKAQDYNRKLVSKTHTGAQPDQVVLPGVFGSSGPSGQVRASALKQYGLLDGSPKAYSASELAKRLNAAPPEELQKYLRQVFLMPKLFKTMFETFCDDKVSRARIRQQAANLKVHPETLDECVSVFVNSAVYAKLAADEGDLVAFSAAPTTLPAGDESQIEDALLEESPDGQNQDGQEDDGHFEEEELESKNRDAQQPRRQSHIELKIDPSMDPEKLEKLLKVLRKYGQI